MKEAGQGFAAVALFFIVGAEVEAIHFGVKRGEGLLEILVNFLDGFGGVFAQGDAALVGDDQDTEAGLIELCDGLWNAG